MVEKMKLTIKTKRTTKVDHPDKEINFRAMQRSRFGCQYFIKRYMLNEILSCEPAWIEYQWRAHQHQLTSEQFVNQILEDHRTISSFDQTKLQFDS